MKEEDKYRIGLSYKEAVKDEVPEDSWAFQEQQQKEQPKKKISLRGPLPPCSHGLSREQLRHYLFFEKAGADTDESIRTHLEIDDCAACQREVIELKVQEPYLAEENYKLPVPHAEIIRKKDSGNPAQDNTFIADLAGKVGQLIQTPAKAFNLQELFVMYGQLRSVSDEQKRKTIGEQIKDACQARWARVAPDHKPPIEAAADELLTLIKDDHKKKVNSSELALSKGGQTAEFLNYLMTQDYFLNLKSKDSTWDLHGPKNQPNAEIGISTEAEADLDESIDLHLGVLRRALSVSSPSSDPAQTDA